MDNRNWRNFIQAFACLALLTLVGCSFNPSVVDHSFSFDVRRDSQDVEVLNYRYGDSRIAAARTQDYQLREGKTSNFTNVNGEMRRGDFLYVKWRIKSTGEIYEDTVDLRSRLPTSIKNHRIHFVIKGPQLYVYLISPERRPPGTPPNGPSIYNYLDVKTIYPDQPNR